MDYILEMELVNAFEYTQMIGVEISIYMLLLTKLLYSQETGTKNPLLRRD